jgi:hypothetical protein
LTASVPSYRKVAYDLRPAKQIERRMIVDALQVLSEGGFRIRDYQYTGFGSVYFVDFILFHRLLGLTRLLSVEIDKGIEKRVWFNKPFSQVAIQIAPISSVIPKLDMDLRHLLWLDYDVKINKSVIEDTVLAATRLTPGSILLLTVDAEPPAGSGPEEWRMQYESEVGDFLPYGLRTEDFGQGDLPHINAQILFNAIRNGIVARSNIDFKPLFNFEYRDGHRMVTVGGIFASPTEASMLNGCNFSHAEYLRTHTSARPWPIEVPRVTRRERAYLDQFMPAPLGWSPPDFELETEDIENYRRIYRYFPLYAELAL